MDTELIPPREKPEPPAPRHSGLGIASFAIGILAGLALFIALGVVAVLYNQSPGGLDEKSPTAILAGLLIIGLCLVHLLGVGLGIGGLAQKDRRKVFSVLGLAINGVALLGTIALIIIGNLMD